MPLESNHFMMVSIEPNALTLNDDDDDEAGQLVWWWL